MISFETLTLDLPDFNLHFYGPMVVWLTGKKNIMHTQSHSHSSAQSQSEIYRRVQWYAADWVFCRPASVDIQFLMQCKSIIVSGTNRLHITKDTYKYILINVLFVIEIIMIMDKKHSQNYGLCFNRTSITPYYEEVIVIHITVIQSSIRISMRHNV